MTDSAYKRGYDRARAEISEAMQQHNKQLAARLAEINKPAILDAFGERMGPPPLSDYDRGVLNGAITANRTTLMYLGHTSADKPDSLGLQPGD